jgi:hypothetical protein
VASPLAEIVQRAVTAAREVDSTDDDAAERARDTVQATQTACRGGRRAVELLPVYDDNGRTHPAAGPLLWALVAPSDSEVSTTHEWHNHELAGDDDPVRISAVDMARTTVLADRAHRFATVRRPPALEAGGGDCPLVGLDATGRSELWETVVGTDMRRRDPHGSAAARWEFLRYQGLRVVQTTPEAKTYHGSVDAASMDGDTAVVEAAADEYAPQVGDDPAVVTTLKAEHAASDRFEAAGADSVDHYGDLKGSNRLGDQRLGVLLGCQHHGHGAVERAAAFAHQDATPTSRGIDQSYGPEVGDAYLRYMWHDSVMQAALRFGRDPEIDETVVVAHTAALRDDLPVVAEGDVVKTYSAGEKRVAEAVADLRGSFTTADVRERLPGDPNPRSVRWQLAALVEAGHLDRTETPNGVATQFSDPEAPSAG